ncbi:MAG: SusC/RagA family TonB-linked outer membrane protein [Cyclobacteriaceae bacterium]|nr:SusC/RagA family TonB-linked outer membrane protein [Cyclobacteriaceae bacterium]
MLTKFTFYGIIAQFFLLSVLLANDGNAQGVENIHKVRARLGFQNASLEKVFKEIEKKTDYKFAFDKKDLASGVRFDLQQENHVIADVLLELSRQSNLAFRQINNTIFVHRNEHKDKWDDAVLETTYQNIRVTGKITTVDSNEGLPGVNVIIKGTSTGTITDINGAYQIEVPDQNTVLVFSSVGFVREEVIVGTRSVIDLKLTPDITALEEIVVVGYGEQRKATITGSVSTIKGAEIIEAPVTNVSNALAGRLPGLVAVTRSSEPGADGSILRIRGLNTLGDNSPLIVVDGIPGRSIDRLEPNSIESITILKDASAAIYGAQAANGVILITTKRGQTGKPEITFNLNQGAGQPTRLPRMANATEYATMLNEIDIYQGRTPRYTDNELVKFADGSDPWRYPDTDWFSEVLRPWSGQSYANMTVSGGSENVKYFLLGGVRSQQGYYKKSAANFRQIDFRTNIDAKISNHIKLGFDVAGREENREYPVRSANAIFRMVMRGKPHMHAYWPDGTPGPDIEYGDNPAVVSTDATGYDRDNWYVLNSNVRLDIDIPWIKGLSFNSNAGIDKGFQFRKRFETPWYLYSWDGQSVDASGQPVLERGKKGFADPRLSQFSQDYQDILLNGMLNYQFDITDNHAFKIMVGSERRTRNMERFSAYRRFFVSTAIDQLFAGGELEMSNTGVGEQQARFNYFGRVNYAYSDKYLLEFLWRYDGSFIFHKVSRYGFFPGVSAGWRVSEESFWKDNVSFMDEFKIRGSWGQTGNDRIELFQYLASYTFGRWDARDWSSTDFRNQTLILGVDQENKALYEALIPNSNVTWEVANQTNIGVETRFFDGKMFFEADYFYNLRSQILWARNASIPGSTGLTLPRENIGRVQNAGFDFNIGYNGQAGQLRYMVAANGGYAKNKILFWDETPGVPEYQQSTGRPMGSALYYEAIGIFKDEEHLSQYPSITGARPGDIIFKDVNGDGVIDGNDRVRNEFNNIPRFSGGLNINMFYKGFDLAILFQGAAGAVQYVQTESGEIGNYLKSFYDQRWTADNPNATGPRTFNRDNEYWRNNWNTHFLHRTDYIRLKNLQFGYSLPARINDALGTQNFRIYISGFNLLTYSPDYKDFDPENASASGQGYPLQRVFNGGVTITF